MDTFVYQTLAPKEEHGMILIDPANVQITKFGKMKLAFLQKFYVLMVRFGIQQSMLAFVHQEHSLLLIAVILFHFAMGNKFITHTIINANVHMVYNHQEINACLHIVLKI